LSTKHAIQKQIGIVSRKWLLTTRWVKTAMAPDMKQLWMSMPQ